MPHCVERGGTEVAVAQGTSQGVLVDELAARGGAYAELIAHQHRDAPVIAE